MNASSNSPASAPLEDPRCRHGFLPQFYPRANGKEGPPVASKEPNDRLMLDFLATYYELNCAYARLQEARRKPVSPQRKELERKCLQAVERLLIGRDQLEDHHAPFGVIAEPVVQNGFTVNVKFSFGNMDAAGKRRSDWYTVTACVPVPMPNGTKLEDFSIHIEGPGIVPE